MTQAFSTYIPWLETKNNILGNLILHSPFQVHEIVVVARDGGEVPQETSAFITVRLTDAAGGAETGFTTTRRPPTTPPAARQLKMVYFSRKNSVPEDLSVGKPFAKLLLTEAAIVDENVVDYKLVHQGRRVFKLFKNSTAAYLTVARELDFEEEPRYDVTVSRVILYYTIEV